jgi:hypothetical protein
MSQARMQKDWSSKSLAGGILGLAFAFACSGIYTRLVTGLPLPVKAQLAMWMIAPIWLSIFALVYLFRSGMRAWICLGGLNLIAWTGVFVLYSSAG